MFKCDSCRRTFEEPATRAFKSRDEFQGAPFWRTDYEDSCPLCGSLDIRELRDCRECGEAFEDKDMIDDTCRQCAATIDAEG